MLKHLKIHQSHIYPTGNDVDEEGDPLQLTEVGQPNPDFGDRDVDGTKVTYTPDPCTEAQRTEGSYTITMNYGIQDQDDALTASSIMTVKVICNQRPTANPDSDTTNENDPVKVPVIDNDTDPER